MKTHELKTTPAYFEPVWTGEKTFEIRYDDRNYQRGDRVVLREHDYSRPCFRCAEQRPGGGRDHRNDDCDRYTGREVEAEIGCVIASTPNRGSQRGFWGNGYVVFALVKPVHVTVVDRDDEEPGAPAPASVKPTGLAAVVMGTFGDRP